MPEPQPTSCGNIYKPLPATLVTKLVKTRIAETRAREKKVPERGLADLIGCPIAILALNDWLSQALTAEARWQQLCTGLMRERFRLR